MKYFLLWNKQTNAMVIDTRVRTGWKTENKVEASSWIEAKKLLGFELSPLQQRLLDEKDNRAEISRRTIQHKQDAGAELWLAHRELLDGIEALQAAGERV